MISSSLSIRAVLFDRDNTLAYTDVQVYKEAASWLAKNHNLNPEKALQTMIEHWQSSASEWHAIQSLKEELIFWRNYADTLAPKLNISAESAQTLLQTYPYERFMKLVPNVRDVLIALRNLGLQIGIFSNTLPSIDKTLTAIGIDDLVDVALASCSLGAHKPNVQAFELAANALKLSPQEILFIDDLEENIIGARQVGMQAQLIDLTGKNPDAIQHPQEVLSLLRQVNNVN